MIEDYSVRNEFSIYNAQKFISSILDEEILVIATVAVIARPAIKLHTFAFLEGIFISVCLEYDLLIGDLYDLDLNILFFIEDTEFDFGKIVSYIYPR